MFNMKRKTCFYKWLVAVFVLICNTITMSAQTKVTSANQLKAGCVIKIYPKERYQDHYDDKDYALACSGDGQPLDTYKNVVSGDEWTLEDTGDGSCYVKNNNGCYWAYQGSSLDEGMKCTANKSSAVKVKLTWDSKNGGVCFWNDIDGSGLIGYGDSFYWWTYPDEDDPYFHVTFDIALLKEGNGSDFVQKEMTTVVDGIKYSLDANQKTAKVIANNHSYSGDIDIPANITYDNVVYKINALGFGCFADCEGLKSIKLPDGITSIEGRCFNNCENLQSVDLPSGITSLGVECFAGCEGLKSIKLPDGITSLGESCFYFCSSLTSIDLPSNIRSFGESCFESCYGLTHVSLAEGITSLGVYCFSDCSSLTSIDLPSGITSLGGSCFEYCSSLTSISLPESLTSLGVRCFYDCISLANVHLSSDKISLGNVCFSVCCRLTSIDLPYGITSLVDWCFSDCSSLTKISLPERLTSLGGECFEGCSSLKTISLPSGITSLDYSCFKDCSSLIEVSLPSGITSLGDWCFLGCSSLKSINLPESINSLGSSCFSGCKGLASVYVYAEQLPTMGYTVFENCDADNCILYVPKGTIDMYRQSDFGYFKNIVELDATGINNPMTSTNLKEVSRYTVNGKRLTTPTKGVNVVKYSNGMVKKELVK